MAVELLLAPVGAGKTQVALERLVATLETQPFARVWVLVSGRRQEDAFRQRLVEWTNERHVYFNVEFLSFYGLYERLLNIMQQPTYKLEDAGRYGLLRAILDQHADELQVYGAIARTPGFVHVMADLIYELKQNVIRHATFEKVARLPKDRDLALIYRKYQEKLIEKDVVDREGEGWLALFKMYTEPKQLSVGSEVDLLLVDGFDQFTPLQAQLLMLLANRAQNALITLATVPDREQTVGRRFSQALKRLLESNPSGYPAPNITHLDLKLTENRAPALRHLVDNIFRPNSPRQFAGHAVTFIEAPDPAREAGAVLRRVKRLLLATDCQPDDIVIALRDWGRYAGHIAAFGHAYGLQLALHRGHAVAQNPSVIMLLHLLRLHERDFRRRDLLDVLRSPYFHIPGIGREQADQLEKISRQLIVTGGSDNWLKAVERAARPINNKDDDEEAARESLLSPEQADQLTAALTNFFKAVTPPEQGTLDSYVSWLDALVGSDKNEDPEIEASAAVYTFDMPAQIRQDSGTHGVIERDLAAMDELKRVLRYLRSSNALLGTLGEGGEITRADFILQLTAALDGAAVNQRPARSGRVLVTTVADARGLPHKHVFIPGLSEGLFPAPLSEDPIYLDSERLKLTERGIPLETQAERASDEGLFYELICLAHDTLTLSRPTVQDGAQWVASHLWREAVTVFTDAEQIIADNRIKIGTVVEDVATYDEAALAVAHALNHTELSDPSLYNWLLAEAGWQRINTARRVELERSTRLVPFDRYSGRLANPQLIDYVRDQLSPERFWSASQLNDYGVCGFRFFAKRLLRLDTLDEPEDDLDAAKLGTINHEILEKSYGEYARRGLAIHPDNAPEALVILHEIATPVLRRAPFIQGFRESALWEQEKVALLRRLESLIRLDFSEQSPIVKKFAVDPSVPRYTYNLEALFGKDGSVQIPIVVDGQTEGLRVFGYIDRMDKLGDSVVVIDYKTGTTRIPVEDMREGRNFQMMVYLLAAQRILERIESPDAPTHVLGGLFWHIRDQKPSGDLLLNTDDGQQAIEYAQNHIGRYIAAGRRGDFTVKANKPSSGRCTRYCEFAQFCRSASTHHHKP